MLIVLQTYTQNLCYLFQMPNIAFFIMYDDHSAANPTTDGTRTNRRTIAVFHVQENRLICSMCWWGSSWLYGTVYQEVIQDIIRSQPPYRIPRATLTFTNQMISYVSLKWSLRSVYDIYNCCQPRAETDSYLIYDMAKKTSLTVGQFIVVPSQRCGKVGFFLPPGFNTNIELLI